MLSMIRALVDGVLDEREAAQLADDNMFLMLVSIGGQ